jgi:tetratricopeptide (TPR) repeat protein
MTISPPSLIKLFLAPLAVFGALLALLAALNGGSGLPAIGDPGAPTGDPVADFQRAVRAAPDNADAYAGLGDAYLARAREIGDPGYYTRADRAFDAALRRKPADLGALIGAGALAGLRHDFHAQLALGRRALAVAPELARSLPVIADAEIELGRYDDAARDIQRLVDTKPGLAAYARASYYRELSGDLPGAIDAMKLAVASGGAPEGRAYVQVLLGDLELVRGRVPAARIAYVGALRSLPGYPAGLVGLARADAAGGDLGRAAARLRRAAEKLPLTSTLTRLAVVEAARGRDRAAAAALDTARAEQGLYRAARTAPDAEAVLFETDFGSASKAIALGRRVWAAAPSVRSADALGWALTRNGRREEGSRWARRARRLGSADPLFAFHAGMAARGAERERLLRIALDHGLGARPWQAKQAREALR